MKTYIKKIIILMALIGNINNISALAQNKLSPDTVIIKKNTAVTINVRANDSYDKSYITINYPDFNSYFGFPAHGRFIVLNNDSILYRPDAGYYGIDKFTYGIARKGVTDQNSAIDTASVYIIIRPE